jgi:mannose-1-phosphate guanylyltransferase/mannose-6-phosphate isomerase
MELGVVPTLIQPVILCGGAGTRLWPRSLERYAKPLVICEEAERFGMAEEMRRAGMRSQAILLAPGARGTAPALTLAAVHSVTADDPVLLAVAADTDAARIDAMERALERAAALARQGHLVFFGVPPAEPGTGHRYLRAGARVNGAHPVEAKFIDAVVDAPDARCYRSTGILAVRASVWIDAVGSLRRPILTACERAYRLGRRDGEFLRMDARAFAACPADSIDFAVLEPLTPGHGAPEAVVVRL